jgi:flagellar hook-length control protein FliK
VFDPIAPATLIGRNAPPAIAFGTSAEDDDTFDEVLREAAADEPAEPARERRRADRSDRAPAERPEPVTEKQAERPSADAAPEAAAVPAETSDAAAPEAAPATATGAEPAAAGTAAPPAAAATAAIAQAPVIAATPALAPAAAPADPASLSQGRPAAAPTAASANELPTLQQLQTNAGFAGTGGEADGRDLPGERRLPQALAQLLQPVGTGSAGATAAAGQSSVPSALAGTALGTSLKPDAANATTGAAAALPTAATAAINPATAMAPLPGMDPMQPLAGTGFAGHAGDSEMKQIATLGATPARAAVPTTTPSLQIAMHIAKAAQDGMSKVSVRLDPPELGRVDIKLEVGHDGRVQAVVSADRQETLDMLQRDARDLARALKDAGLQADTGNLNFSLRQNGGDGPAADDGRGRAPNGDLLADEPLAGDMAGLDAAPNRPTVAGNHALDISV